MLDISLVVMLVEAGIFLVTLILLNQWLFKPLLGFMESRDAKLEKELKNVSNNTNEAKKYEEEIAKILENAKSEAMKIKKVASEEAKKEAVSMVESEVSKIEVERKSFYSQLENKKIELSKILEANSKELQEVLSNKLKGIA